MGCRNFYGFAQINSSLPDLGAFISLAVQIKDNQKDIFATGFKIAGAFLGFCLLIGKYPGEYHGKKGNH
jgi:hypothetical protein